MQREPMGLDELIASAKDIALLVTLLAASRLLAIWVS